MLDGRCINTLRFLAVDAVKKANSGHPGLPLGAAAMAHVLWTRFLKHHPANPAGSTAAAGGGAVRRAPIKLGSPKWNSA